MAQGCIGLVPELPSNCTLSQPRAQTVDVVRSLGRPIANLPRLGQEEGVTISAGLKGGNDMPNEMRGKAKAVLMSVEKRDGLDPFVIFTRWKPKLEGDRVFHHITGRQIERVAGAVNRMSRIGKLSVYAHAWGWAGRRK